MFTANKTKAARPEMAEEPNANAMGNEEEMKNDGMKAVETRRSKRRRRE